MFDGRFVGFADFLVRDGQRYRVVDTKLARSAKVTALLQLVLQVLFFYWFIVATRMTLGTPWTLAAGLMVVNWVPSYFLSILVNRLLGVSLGV